MVFCRERGIETSILRLACCGLSLGLLIISAGCTQRLRSVEHAEVTGKVLFQGKPLPGGVVNFVAVNGAFANTGFIDENGNYKIKAPEGEVRIGVDNRMLANQGSRRERPKEENTIRQKKLAEVEKVQPPQGPLKGRYVQIPKNYTDPTTSGLTYTVKPGSQTHDIELSDKP
jgi:hypothetical protein